MDISVFASASAPKSLATRKTTPLGFKSGSGRWSHWDEIGWVHYPEIGWSHSDEIRWSNHPKSCRHARKIAGVERADGGSENEIRLHARSHQRTQHADLDGAETTAAGEHQRRLSLSHHTIFHRAGSLAIKLALDPPLFDGLSRYSDFRYSTRSLLS